MCSMKNNLSPREQEILTLIIQGKTNKEIAFLLKLSKSTVDGYVQNSLQKLNVSNRTAAALKYYCSIVPMS
jgi:DNA-binding NarL/FixJ family response regulator